MIMRKCEQILYMQTRIMQIASERWNIPINQTSLLFRQYGIAEMIEENFELYHTEGDEAIYADIVTLLKNKGADIHD